MYTIEYIKFIRQFFCVLLSIELSFSLVIITPFTAFSASQDTRSYKEIKSRLLSSSACTPLVIADISGLREYLPSFEDILALPPKLGHDAPVLKGTNHLTN